MSFRGKSTMGYTPYRGILILEEVFPSGFGKQLPRAVEVMWRHKLKQVVLPHDDQLDKVFQLPLPLAGGTCLVAPPRARTAPASARARTHVASPGLPGFALGATAGRTPHHASPMAAAALVAATPMAFVTFLNQGGVGHLELPGVFLKHWRYPDLHIPKPGGGASLWPIHRVVGYRLKCPLADSGFTEGLQPIPAEGLLPKLLNDEVASSGTAVAALGVHETEQGLTGHLLCHHRDSVLQD